MKNDMTCSRCHCPTLLPLTEGLCRFCAVLAPDPNLAAVSGMLADARKTLADLDYKANFYQREFVVGPDRNVVARAKM